MSISDLAIVQASELTVGAFIDLAAMLTRSGFVDDADRDRARSASKDAVAFLAERIRESRLGDLEEAYCLCIVIAALASKVVEMAHMSELRADIEGYERGDA